MEGAEESPLQPAAETLMEEQEVIQYMFAAECVCDVLKHVCACCLLISSGDPLMHSDFFMLEKQRHLYRGKPGFSACSRER